MVKQNRRGGLLRMVVRKLNRKAETDNIIMAAVVIVISTAVAFSFMFISGSRDTATVSDVYVMREGNTRADTTLQMLLNYKIGIHSVKDIIRGKDATAFMCVQNADNSKPCVNAYWETHTWSAEQTCKDQQCDDPASCGAGEGMTCAGYWACTCAGTDTDIIIESFLNANIQQKNQLEIIDGQGVKKIGSVNPTKSYKITQELYGLDGEKIEVNLMIEQEIE